MSNKRDELENAIEDLCSQLFSSKTASDALPIMQAATALAASSRVAQCQLGRALEVEEQHQPGRIEMRHGVIRFRLLAERYLYDPVSSVPSLALLAVLSHKNARNQRRVARYLHGISIAVPRSKSLVSHTTIPVSDEKLPRFLLILSLPTALRSQFKQWRSRNQLLHGHRVPSGIPPSTDGVPSACFCDECLGSPQLLPTWVDHYEDMSRWTTDCHITGSQTAAPRQLYSEIFLQTVFDSHYSLQSCAATACARTNNSEAPFGYSSPTIYFFTATTSVDELIEDRPPREPDPHRDVCAIEIDQSAKRFMPNSRYQDSKQPADSPPFDDEPVGRILLLRQQAAMSRCLVPSYERKQRDSMKCAGTEFMQEFKNRVNELSESTVGQLQEFVRTSHILSSIDRVLFCNILQFLDPLSSISDDNLQEILVPLIAQFQLGKRHESFEGACSESGHQSELCDVQVAVILPNQVVEIAARPRDGRKYVRSFEIAQTNEGHSSSASHDLCALDEESLFDLVQNCRLCQDHAHEQDDPKGRIGWFCLIPNCTTSSGLTSPYSRSAEKTQSDTRLLSDQDARVRHARGLSSLSETLLRDLEARLISGSPVRPEEFASIFQKLIHDCNVRMKETALSRTLPLHVRAGVRERCRTCRDLLFQIGKRLKLAGSDELSRIARGRLQREIARVLYVSELLEEWETPDPRVHEMLLCKRVWASGLPDPEFYTNSELHLRKNRTTQRRLNQRLVAKMRRALQA